jgi:hypothetical protein
MTLSELYKLLEQGDRKLYQKTIQRLIKRKAQSIGSGATFHDIAVKAWVTSMVRYRPALLPGNTVQGAMQKGNIDRGSLTTLTVRSFKATGFEFLLN